MPAKSAASSHDSGKHLPPSDNDVTSTAMVVMTNPPSSSYISSSGPAIHNANTSSSSSDATTNVVNAWKTTTVTAESAIVPVLKPQSYVTTHTQSANANIPNYNETENFKRNERSPKSLHIKKDFKPKIASSKQQSNSYTIPMKPDHTSTTAMTASHQYSSKPSNSKQIPLTNSSAINRRAGTPPPQRANTTTTTTTTITAKRPSTPPPTCMYLQSNGGKHLLITCVPNNMTEHQPHYNRPTFGSTNLGPVKGDNGLLFVMFHCKRSNKTQFQLQIYVVLILMCTLHLCR